ncbi:MAG: hypothetical protein SVP26_11210 [Chloroflexota bacterium]|nr:hypothetical protein [Chloroflexota bacterium]
MITVRCARCSARVFRYEKVGKGRLLHCWKGRIVTDYSVRDGPYVKCPCGNVIGIDEGKWVKLKQRSFTCSGAARRK